MLSDEQRLEQIEKSIDAITKERISAEAHLNMLRKQRDELLEKLAAMGINPNQLADQIQQLKNNIDVQLKAAEDQIPSEFKNIQ